MLHVRFIVSLLFQLKYNVTVSNTVVGDISTGNYQDQDPALMIISARVVSRKSPMSDMRPILRTYILSSRGPRR